MKVGVFGAGGFIGSHLAGRLLERGHAVTAVTRRPVQQLEDLGARTLIGDLTDTETMDKALAGVEVVVQLMGTSTPAQGITRSIEDIQENVLPHVALLGRCTDLGVARFIFASSGGAVYGPVPGDRVIPEDHPTNPISSHGITKRTVEHFIKLHGKIDELDYVIARIANPYGPGQTVKHGQGLVPALLASHAAGQPVTVVGDGSAARDYVYIDDVVDALVRAIELDGHPRLTMNIGTGIHRSINDVIRTLEKVAEIEIQVEHAPARPTDVDRIALDVSRARHLLGWEPRTGFEEGLARTVASLRNK